MLYRFSSGQGVDPAKVQIRCACGSEYAMIPAGNDAKLTEIKEKIGALELGEDLA